MKKQLGILTFSVAILIALAGCALGRQTTTPVPAPTDLPLTVATAAPAPTQIPSSTPASVTTPTAAAAGDPAADSAKKTALDYGTAVQTGDFATAAKLLSDFSLTAAQMTQGDAADALTALKTKGTSWSDFQVKETQSVNSKTLLVHVVYQLTAKDAKTGKATTTAQDELWPVRLENSAWRYNWGNLIDTKTLDAQPRLVSGVTVKPLKMSRYADRIDLNLLVQNSTSDAVVWGGQPSETVAVFHFGDKTVESEKNRLIFDSLRSYPDTLISVKGLFTSYPDTVELRTFKNFANAPWYTFQLTQ
jgi:hypothetical protein